MVTKEEYNKGVRENGEHLGMDVSDDTVHKRPR